MIVLIFFFFVEMWRKITLILLNSKKKLVQPYHEITILEI